MTAKYYTLLTEVGAAKLASATALGVPLKLTHMAVGDGGGTLPTPNSKQVALVAEKRRAALNSLSIDPQNASQIIAEQVIPESDGGWWVREVGLFDDTGDLIAIGNCPESYKPQLTEGSGRTQAVRMVLITSSTDNITLKIDPSVVLATRKYVDDRVLELKVYVDDAMAAHLAAVDPHQQYAQKASPTLTGTPKAPTAAAGNNSTQLATTAFVQAALVALINGAPATLDTLKEIAAAINNDPNFSTTMNNALALKAPLASPALTGIPTAPTAAQTVNNTQIATTAFVKAALAALVGSSPAALDTLNELAAALGNDPNFATTMTNALAGKQPKDSTLTALSGKDVAGILTYLGLRDVAHSQMTSYLVAGTFTFTVPNGVYRIKCRVIGGGGGAGGSASAKSGGGGGAGGYAEGWIDVTPGQTITITVGIGGSGGTAGNFGVSGGLSSIGSYMSASGGAYGDAGGGGTGAGGFGGTGTGGSVNSVGSDGSDGTTTGAVGAGAGGGSALGGSTRSGGSGRNSLSIGGGGSASYTTTAQSGGNGHAGAVILEY